MLRHPLTWFLMIGTLLFAADAWLSDRPEAIVVDRTVRNHVAALAERQTGSLPSAEELDSLVENWIREEVFYREALRLQLDTDDAIIRRRLIQKLTFIAEDVGEPDESELRDYFDAHQQDYRRPPRYTFSQILFSGSDRDALIPVLGALEDNDDEWRRLGEPSMLNSTYSSRMPREIATTFGNEFAEQITDLPTGAWQGPVTSVFGLHLVRVDRRDPAGIPAFHEVERQVLGDYLRERRELARDAYYRTLLDQYEITR